MASELRLTWCAHILETADRIRFEGACENSACVGGCAALFSQWSDGHGTSEPFSRECLERKGGHIKVRLDYEQGATRDRETV